MAIQNKIFSNITYSKYAYSIMKQQENMKLSKKIMKKVITINIDKMCLSIQCLNKTTHFYAGEVGVEVDIISTKTVREFLIQQSTNKVQKRLTYILIHIS